MTPSDSAGRDARLATYREKRHATRTPEPFGGRVLSGGSVFVVQMHAARRLHWDLRLELDGVLLSWAVPKGPSPSQADKRLAVRTEDHPLEYAEFEGVIPDGEYGAGAMIVWDRGVWIPLEDPHEGLEKGKLLFELRGYKLHGKWTLVKTKQDERSWLFIKERDAYEDARKSTEDYPEDSIYSGLAVDAFAGADERARELAVRLQELGARERTLTAREVSLMLAANADAPFSGDEWVFELKYDGYRLLAERRGGEVFLRSRAGHDITGTFPDIARAVRGLPVEGLVLDGEVVVHDSSGKPSFGQLQKRGRIQGGIDALRAAASLPATFYAFDLLALEGYDLRGLPLVERKRVLRDLLPTVGPIRFADHVPAQGEALYEGAVGMGLEGVVGKRADSTYRGGRSRSWLKVRAERTGDLVVVGWTDPGGARTGFGALHLAAYADGELQYAGSVGTGFDEADLTDLIAYLRTVEVDASSCGAGAVPRGRSHHWVPPEIVVEVRYKEVTEQGLLRHPVFLRRREDKPPEECRLEIGRAADAARDDEAWDGEGRDGQGRGEAPDGEAWDGDARDGEAPRTTAPDGAATGDHRTPGEVAPDGAGAAGAAPGRRRGERDTPAPPKVTLSNTRKVFWPEDGYTKGDLVEYHRSIGRWMLPYLRDRPLVMTRYPDGIRGKSFFQKDAPQHAPDWVRTVDVWSEGSERSLSYFVVDDVDALLYVINLGTIPIHVWSSRVGSLERPDWCVLDLDPKEAPFADVVEVALAVRRICDAIGLPSYPKTSGSSGIHVLIPLGGQLDHEQSRTLAQLLGRVVVTELPRMATLVRSPDRRGGKVYVDFVQNGQGRLIAAPFTVRPLQGAPVSAPLDWDQVVPELRIADHTMTSMPERMERLGRDPLAGVLDESPDLLSALSALAERFD